jgi:AraC-like DNA-binding protein
LSQSLTNPYQLILVITAIVASMIVFGQLVVRRDNNAWATGLLATFMLLNGSMNVVFLLVDTGLILDYWYLYRVTAPLNYIMPAMIFIYIRAIVEDDRAPRSTDWFHALPTLFALINYMPFYLSSSADKKEKLEAVVNNYAEYVQGQDGLFPENVMIALRIATLLIYIPFYFHLIYVHQDSMDKSNSYNNRLHIWLWVLVGAISIYFVSVCVFLTIQLLPQSVSLGLRYLLFLGILNGFVELFWTGSFVFFSVYLALVPSVGIGQLVDSQFRGKQPLYLGQTQGQRSSHQHPEIVALTQTVESNAFWKESNASLESLASQLGFSQRKTSYLVNKFLGVNFNQVINKYRIDHAKDLIAQGYLSKHSVEGLWKACGFANHTTFYQAFKKQTGKTPGQYEKQVLGLV